MKKSALLILFLLLLFVVSSCYVAPRKHRYRASRSYLPKFKATSGGFEKSSDLSLYTGGVPANIGDEGNFMDGKTEEGIDKKIVYDADADLRVKKADSANAKLKRIAEKYEGYAQTLGPRKSVIRVRASSLNAALAEIARLGKMQNKSVYGEDVTAEFFDLVLRLDNYERTRTRYSELLAKAVGVSEILKVEKELERVTREIELLKGKLELLKNQIDYSTITINLKERKKLGILGYLFKGVYLGVKWLFVMN